MKSQEQFHEEERRLNDNWHLAQRIGQELWYAVSQMPPTWALFCLTLAVAAWLSAGCAPGIFVPS